jgi:hypothetical protein
MIIGITLISPFGQIFFPEPTIEDYPWLENLLPVMMAVSVIGLALTLRWIMKQYQKKKRLMRMDEGWVNAQL